MLTPVVFNILFSFDSDANRFKFYLHGNFNKYQTSTIYKMEMEFSNDAQPKILNRRAGDKSFLDDCSAQDERVCEKYFIDTSRGIRKMPDIREDSFITGVRLNISRTPGVFGVALRSLRGLISFIPRTFYSPLGRHSLISGQESNPECREDSCIDIYLYVRLRICLSLTGVFPISRM